MTAVWEITQSKEHTTWIILGHAMHCSPLHTTGGGEKLKIITPTKLSVLKSCEVCMVSRFEGLHSVVPLKAYYSPQGWICVYTRCNESQPTLIYLQAKKEEDILGLTSQDVH